MLTITLSSDLMERARRIAREMPESQTVAKMPASEGRGPASLNVQRTQDDLIILGTFEENGTTFYIGTEPIV